MTLRKDYIEIPGPVLVDRSLVHKMSSLFHFIHFYSAQTVFCRVFFANYGISNMVRWTKTNSEHNFEQYYVPNETYYVMTTLFFICL